MYSSLLAVCLTLALIGGTVAEVVANAEPVDKRSFDNNGYHRASNWISVRPSSVVNPDSEIGYLLQYLEKRAGSIESDGDSQRDIRSPLGTMRFGKRGGDSPLGTMRFGKRNPLGTMRFGKRSDSPLGTMRFGKRSFGEEQGF